MKNKILKIGDRVHSVNNNVNATICSREASGGWNINNIENLEEGGRGYDSDEIWYGLPSSDLVLIWYGLPSSDLVLIKDLYKPQYEIECPKCGVAGCSGDEGECEQWDSEV